MYFKMAASQWLLLYQIWKTVCWTWVFLMEIIQARFPSLAEMTQQEVTKLNEPQQLHRLITQITVARDEAAAREILSL